MIVDGVIELCLKLDDCGEEEWVKGGGFDRNWTSSFLIPKYFTRLVKIVFLDATTTEKRRQQPQQLNLKSYISTLTHKKPGQRKLMFPFLDIWKSRFNSFHRDKNDFPVEFGLLQTSIALQRSPSCPRKGGQKMLSSQVQYLVLLKDRENNTY